MHDNEGNTQHQENQNNKQKVRERGRGRGSGREDHYRVREAFGRRERDEYAIIYNKMRRLTNNNDT